MSGKVAEAAPSIHASSVVLGEDGVLIRGPAGTGKSSLCLALLDGAEQRGCHGRLVGDDRIRLSVRHGRLIARPHPSLEGLVEIRGLGLRRLARVAPAAVIRLVVELEVERSRLPEGESDTVEIAGATIRVLRLERNMPREYLTRQTLAALQCSTVASQSHPAALLSGKGCDV